METMARLFTIGEKEMEKKKIEDNFNPPGRVGPNSYTEPSQR